MGQMQQGQMGQSALPQGVAPANLNAADDIHGAFASLTNDALTKDHFDSFADHFDRSDRERIKSSAGNMSHDDLDRAIDTFRQNWKSKYNQDFDAKSNRDAYSGLQISEGKISNPDQLTNWPVNPLQPTSTSGAQKASRASDKDLTKGRDVALATFPATGGESPITASLVHETLRGWKFAIPSSTDAATLQSSLLREVNSLNSSVSSWPSDVHEAYRTVTDHILRATYNVGSESSQGGMSSGRTSSSPGGSSSSQQ